MLRSVRPSFVCGVQRHRTLTKTPSATSYQTQLLFGTKTLHKMADLSTAPIKDYTPWLSVRNLRRKPSAIRELQPLFSLPGMISLGGGMPNPTLFPFEKMQLTLKNGQSLDVAGSDLAEALQYSSSYGLPALINLLKNLQERQHKLAATNVPAWDICVTTGSQDAFEKTFDLLLNEGDYIITENPTYSGTISALNPYNANAITVDCDEHGMKTDQLKKILEEWDWNNKKLKFIYTIPTGQNPSGCSMTLERKKELYRLASKYNILILEDDPYYYLQLPTSKNPVVHPVPSLLSMDTDGRVIRFDSLSKIISAGIRVGWVTGPKHLVERIQIAQQAMVLHASGLSQAAVIALLKSWGEEGWDKQIQAVQKLYSERRDTLLKCAAKHLTGLAEWFEPSAGMFVWFKLVGITDSHELIKTKAVNEKVIMVPGSAFSVDKKPSPYVRASYSIATPEQMDEALKRLATLLKKERGIPTD